MDQKPSVTGRSYQASDELVKALRGKSIEFVENVIRDLCNGKLRLMEENDRLEKTHTGLKIRIAELERDNSELRRLWRARTRETPYPIVDRTVVVGCIVHYYDYQPPKPNPNYPSTPYPAIVLAIESDSRVSLAVIGRGDTSIKSGVPYSEEPKACHILWLLGRYWRARYRARELG